LNIFYTALLLLYSSLDDFLLLLGSEDLLLNAHGSWFFFLSQSCIGSFISWLSW
jgi:hypothetical protein